MKYKIASKPTEGMLFEVKPAELDISIFNIPRQDKEQEEVRTKILTALSLCALESFYTFIPNKTWDDYKSEKELDDYAEEIGGKTANIKHQIFEWAQRISNGEPWEDICNSRDPAKNYRMVRRWDGSLMLVGSSEKCNNDAPASTITRAPFTGIYTKAELKNTVPLVIFPLSKFDTK